MSYQAIPKVGSRKRVWLIVNRHGGLKEEFIGNATQARKRAKDLSETPIVSGTAWDNSHEQPRRDYDTT